MSYTILPYENLSPRIGKDVFIADGAVISGDVELGDFVSVWYNTVVRGDVHYIRIGERTNIQDGSVLHVTHDTNPLIIGKGVTAGHAVKLHGCSVEDFSLVGIGAVVLDGAVVGHHSLVAAGSVVTPGFRIPPGTMVAGVPAKIIRELSEEEMAGFEESAERYVGYARKTCGGRFAPGK